jgi:LemA protein
MAFIVFLGVLVLLLLILGGYIIGIYNGLVSLRNNIDRAWSNIDVLLKQRFDELPKLIKVCEGYMQHEQKTLEAVVKARSMVQNARGSKEKLEAQNMLTDTVFRNLGNRISDIEDQIADRREFFNDSVNLYNIRIEQFPDVLIARSFHFMRRSLWKIDPAHRQDVEVNFQHT